MRVKYFIFFVSTLLFYCSDNNIEPDNEIILTQKLAQFLENQGFQVRTKQNKVLIHRKSIQSSELLSSLTYDFMSSNGYFIDREDLVKSIEFGLEMNGFELQRARIECGSTDYHEGGSGRCSFYYCWDSQDTSYYHMSVYCHKDGKVTYYEY